MVSFNYCRFRRRYINNLDHHTFSFLSYTFSKYRIGIVISVYICSNFNFDFQISVWVVILFLCLFNHLIKIVIIVS